MVNGQLTVTDITATGLKKATVTDRLRTESDEVDERDADTDQRQEREVRQKQRIM